MTDLPVEIISSIIASLDRHALSQVALINKDWNAACSPLLWSDLRSPALTNNDLLQAHPFQQGLSRNRRHIRNVRCSWGDSLLLPLLSCVLPDLDLVMLSCKPALYEPVGDLNSFFLVLESSPRLRSLRLGTLLSPIANAERLLLTIARSLPLLMTLDLFTDALVSVPPRIVREFLETYSQKLETMSLNINFCTCEPSNAETRMLKEPVTGSRAHPNLKSFTLPIQQNSSYADWVEAMVPEDFLRSCTRLETAFDCASLSQPGRSWLVDNPVIFNTV